jgi:hypothetical protein
VVNAAIKAAEPVNMLGACANQCFLFVSSDDMFHLCNLKTIQKYKMIKFIFHDDCIIF